VKKRLLKILYILFLLCVIAGSIAFVAQINVWSAAKGRLFTSIDQIQTEDPPRVAIVFGASVYPDGEPSPVLNDRIATAVDLYKAGKAGKLLMSGDNPTQGYDEPTTMKNTAVKLGVPERDIVMDFAGRRTYDTCYRAKEVFAVQKAILVTQEYHQPRALYLCSNMGIDVIGITSDRYHYREENYWRFREFFSIISAWFEMNFIPFKPIGGEKTPIEY
jgi:vancomycin permeability regulator SanA